MSGILWREMVSQGMTRTRSEATRLVKTGAILLEFTPSYRMKAEYDDLDLPGKTVVRCGKHMFRLVPRIGSEGFDQLRGRIEIPVTPPEDDNGCIQISLSAVKA
jgi:hypothetical protein